MVINYVCNELIEKCDYFKKVFKLINFLGINIFGNVCVEKDFFKDFLGLVLL